ncbi:MAG: ABC transporter substrate-binding protein [Deltaproteobacteria bacterium]|nr:ABC transporter substrate-binding protein [Deltaproteobacteria bacterium]
MRFSVAPTVVALVLVSASHAALAAPPSPAPSPAPPAVAPAADPNLSHPAVKAITTLIGAVRYGKFVMGLKTLDGTAQGAFLLGDNWSKGTDAQRAEFATLFHTIFAKVAFPKMQKNFENIQTVVYDAPVVTGTKAAVKSTLVVLHALKKQEYKLKYQLLQAGAEWKVVDVDVLGESMLTGVRNEQINPIIKEGGWAHLLDLMRQKAKSLEGVPLK